jgi:indolepyruvate ferredoxin oxidoreductase
MDAVKALVTPAQKAAPRTLDERIAFFAKELKAYQNAAYADRYGALVEKAKSAEERLVPAQTGFAEAVAANLFKLMAIKDEYEVARLYTDGTFARDVGEAFEGKLRFEFHLSPPLLAPKDPVTGLPRKMNFGPWIMPLFKVMARMKGLRGTALDLFGRTHERKTERQVLADYEALISDLCHKLTVANHDKAVALADLPQKLRGYGHVKERNLKVMQGEQAVLLAAFASGGTVERSAAE